MNVLSLLQSNLILLTHAATGVATQKLLLFQVISEKTVWVLRYYNSTGAAYCHFHFIL